MSYQVRIVYYLEPTVHTFDLDWLHADPQLLPDTYVTMRLPRGLKERVELASGSFARSRSGQWFVHHTNDKTDEGWDGDTQRFRSLQAVPLALLLCLNPNLRFGPILETLSPSPQCSFTVSWRDQLASHNSPFRKLPTYFFNYATPPSESQIRTVAIDLMNTWSIRRISLIRDRYVRACMADRRDRKSTRLNSS